MKEQNTHQPEITRKAATSQKKSFSQVLLRCQNIIQDNDKISPEAAFDEISKIIFAKFLFERNQHLERQFYDIDEENIRLEYNQFQCPGLSLYYKNIINLAKKNLVFEPGNFMRIKQSSFESIIRELDEYDLADMGETVKGKAFEDLLTKTFRGQLAQFFTSRILIDFIVEALDPQEGELICDPCCGSGGFLIKAYEHIRRQMRKDITTAEKRLEKQTAEKGRIHTYLKNELTPEYRKSRTCLLSHDCILGIDVNPRMVRAAQMNMSMHGIRYGNILTMDSFIELDSQYDNRFDVVFADPPVRSRLNPNQEEEIQKQYQAAKTSKAGQASEILFIERCLRLLKPGGRLGIILPEYVLDSSNLQTIREMFEGMAKILLIATIPQDISIASGANIKSSILFLKKFTSEEKTQYDNARKSKEENWRRLFDYEIPISHIEKAGITSTGVSCENELIPLLKEYTRYRKDNRLWETAKANYEYRFSEGRLFRKNNNEDWIEL